VIAILRELGQTGIYKRSQGRIARQVTFAAIALVVAIGCWRLSETLDQVQPALRYGISAALLAVSVWIAYRIVNVPAVADFLIAVEAEMNKVSWPTRSELIRASVVVLITIFVLATILTLFDLFWSGVFRTLGIIRGGQEEQSLLPDPEPFEPPLAGGAYCDGRPRDGPGHGRWSRTNAFPTWGIL